MKKIIPVVACIPACVARFYLPVPSECFSELIDKAEVSNFILRAEKVDQTWFKYEYEQASNLGEVKESFTWGAEMALTSINYTQNPDENKSDTSQISRITSVRFDNL